MTISNALVGRIIGVGGVKINNIQVRVLLYAYNQNHMVDSMYWFYYAVQYNHEYNLLARKTHTVSMYIHVCTCNDTFCQPDVSCSYLPPLQEVSGAQINISRGSSNARTPERIVTIKVSSILCVCVYMVHVPMDLPSMNTYKSDLFVIFCVNYFLTLRGGAGVKREYLYIAWLHSIPVRRVPNVPYQRPKR